MALITVNSCKNHSHIREKLQAKPHKIKKYQHTQTKHILYVITQKEKNNPDFNLRTKHTIQVILIKTQTTHMLFSSSSPPKGKVCREKWRGSPI